jgi:alpha-ketoglutarate-dependent taurine dioxygenase
MTAGPNPFLPNNEAAYQAWREDKLAGYPISTQELIVEVADPRNLSTAEHQALAQRLRKTNMAIYASPCVEPDKDIPRKLGAQFGLLRLDSNLLADEDAISSLEVAAAGSGQRRDFIPYTNQPIKWHTDGYYNRPERRICGMILHCVRSAASGGENALMDHEMAYLLLRDENPEHVVALLQPDAMTIPARMDDNTVARAAETGPVFSVLPDSGALHMRYTARTRSIEWKQTPAVLAAVAALEKLLANGSPFVFHARLEAGMGLICNNVLHNRSGFADNEQQQRLLYRARYFDRSTDLR